MPLANPTLLGTVGSSGTTISQSPSRDVQVGEFIVVTLTETNFGVSSLVDNSAQAGAANTYVQDKAYTTLNPFVYIYSCKLTRKILSTDTITATFGGSGLCTVCIVALPDAAAATQLDQTASTHSASSSTTYTSGTTPTTLLNNEYAVGIAAFSVGTFNPGGGQTADAPWVLQGNASTTGYGSAHGSLVMTSKGAYTFTGGWGGTEDGAGQSGAIATYRGNIADDVSSIPLPLAARISYVG